jgi:hypothetical protein
MNINTIWINKLFNSFIKNSNITLVFEKKDKLKSNDKILNLSIHPIRFADDIFFNFKTNDDKIKKKLKQYEVNYAIFYHYADIVKATYLKTIKKTKINENSLLLIGQTEKDKVIFDGRKYLSLLDYKDNIKSIAKNYDNIYFKPHPYAKNNKLIYKVLKKEFKNLTIVYDNVYHLLSNENIKHIVGLNSSVLYEAKYFRKDVTFLYKHTFDIGGNDIGIYGDYFTSSFWSDILDIEDTNISLPFVPNRLRKSINDFWGYNEISDEIVLKDIIKTKIKYFLVRYLP